MISKEIILQTVLDICKKRKSECYIDVPNSIIVESNDNLIRFYTVKTYDDIVFNTQAENRIHESVCYDFNALEAYIQELLNDFTNTIITLNIKIISSYLAIDIVNVNKECTAAVSIPQRMKVAKNVNNV